jgi:hypothetical protein
MKRWTLASVIRTDILQRGVPWMLLMKRSRISETDLNVRPEQKICVAVAGLMTLVVAAAAVTGRPWLLAAVPAGLALIVAWNADFYRFLARRRGWGFALSALPLHYVYYCCCGASVVIAMGLWHLVLRRDKAAATTFPPQSAAVRTDPPAAARARPAPAKAQAGRPSRWIRW